MLHRCKNCCTFSLGLWPRSISGYRKSHLLSKKIMRMIRWQVDLGQNQMLTQYPSHGSCVTLSFVVLTFCHLWTTKMISSFIFGQHWTMWMAPYLPWPRVNHFQDYLFVTYIEHWAKRLFVRFWMNYWLNYRSKCPEVADLCYFGIIPMR